MAIKAITLAPGESYVLPPGADVLSVSVPGVVTAEKGCTDLENLEELTCYIFTLVGHKSTAGLGKPWEMNHASVNMFTVNNVSTPISIQMDRFGLFDYTAIQTFMTTDPAVMGLFIDVTAGQAGNGDRGGLVSICFKTIPSIAESMYLNVVSDMPQQPTALGYTEEWRVYPVPYADYTGRDKCSCTSV